MDKKSLMNFNETIYTSVKKRIPWLLTLLFFGLVISLVVSGFEIIFMSIPILVFFQSLILGMAGNAGTQSLSVTIRLMVTKEINKKEAKKILAREIKIGFINGLLICFISFIVVFLFLIITGHEIIFDYGFSYYLTFIASLVVSTSLFVSIVIASFIGTITPIILLKIKIDPAVASGPFITSFNDILAVVIYYTLSYIIFKGLIG